MIHPRGNAVKPLLFIQLFPYASYLCKIKTNSTRMPILPPLIISCIPGCRGCGRWKERDSRARGWARRWVFARWSRGLEQVSVNVKIQSLPRALRNAPCLFILFFLKYLFFANFICDQDAYCWSFGLNLSWDKMRYLFLFGGGSHICGL